ncbi:MAG: response regulator [Oligoflexales bacterium]|nr:response regulator [Oligoflexales bacterium]
MAKILIIDDSRMVRSIIHKILKKENHEVIEASDGLEAIKALKEHRDIEMVFVDVHMPNMDGLAFIREIVVNDKDIYPEVSIAVVSTENRQDLKKLAKLSGVIGWLEKPVSREKVIELANKGLEGTKSA